jgi:hypothetical protein
MNIVLQDLGCGTRMLLKRPGFTLIVLLMMQSMQFGRQAPARALVIKDVTVIDVFEAKVRTHMTVVISGGRIATLGEAGKVAAPKDAMIVDGTGKFLTLALGIGANTALSRAGSVQTYEVQSKRKPRAAFDTAASARQSKNPAAFDRVREFIK